MEENGGGVKERGIEKDNLLREEMGRKDLWNREEGRRYRRNMI